MGPRAYQIGRKTMQHNTSGHGCTARICNTCFFLYENWYWLDVLSGTCNLLISEAFHRDDESSSASSPNSSALRASLARPNSVDDFSATAAPFIFIAIITVAFYKNSSNQNIEKKKKRHKSKIRKITWKRNLWKNGFVEFVENLPPRQQKVQQCMH